MKIFKDEAKRHRFILFLLVMVIGCNPIPQRPGSTPIQTQTTIPKPTPTEEPESNETFKLSDMQGKVDDMKALCCSEDWWNYLSEAEYKQDEDGEGYDTGAAFLEHLEAAGERLDVNEYFNILTHLEPEEGYVLDYVYFAPGGDGFPRIYARQESNPGYASFNAYEASGESNYLDHIQADGSAESFFELALLDIMGGQFYLSWHAAYNDKEVVSSHQRLQEIIQFLKEKYRPLTQEQVEDVLQLDVTPTVEFREDQALVRVLVFTKWGGFFERVYTIQRDFPHWMLEEDTELIPYDCGILF